MKRFACMSLALMLSFWVLPAAPGQTKEARAIEDFAGKWQGTLAKAVLNRQQDLEVTIEFDKKGKGFPDFRTPSGDRVILTGAVQAQITKEGSQFRVVLLRDWAIALDADAKTMTWSEKGGGKLVLKKQK